MKKFWIVLLSLGLVAAFTLPAAAVDLKISGSYFIQGIYENNRSLLKTGIPDTYETIYTPTWIPNKPISTDHTGYWEPGFTVEKTPGVRASSMAYFAQRLRLEPEIKVVEGVNLHMRIDAMERVWGQFGVGSETDPSSIGALNTRNKLQEQNVQFRRAWIDFVTPIGLFMAGYMADGAWGTDFGDIPTEGPTIVYLLPVKPLILIAGIEKCSEGRLGYNLDLSGLGMGNMGSVAPGYVDSDFDKYFFGFDFQFPQGSAGILGEFLKSSGPRPLSAHLEPYVAYGGVTPGDYNLGFELLKSYTASAYFKTTFGPLYVEGEYFYWWGDAVKFENLKQANYIFTMEDASAGDATLSASEWYLKAQYNMGPAYIGAQYGYAQGDDPGTPDKVEAFPSPGYGLWQPCLIMFEDWTNRWSGNLGTSYATLGNAFANASLYQVFAGWNPIPKLGLAMSYTWSYADQAPINEETGLRYADDYGTEFDITATYKIYDNLSYKVGFAYLWTGDYFKGGVATNQIDNDYLLMHQLTLSF